VTGVLFSNLHSLVTAVDTIDFAGRYTPAGRTPGGEFPLQPPGCARLVSPAARALRRLVRQIPPS